MVNYIRLSFFLSSAILLSACGDGGSGDSNSVNEPTSAVQFNCISQCTSFTVSFDNNTIDIFDTPNQNPDLTNALISHDLYQNSSTDNYVFSTSAQQISNQNSTIQSVNTKVTFGYDSFPVIGTDYQVVDPAYVYENRNHGIPYIRGVHFDITTNSGAFFEGSILAGDIAKIRVMAPVEQLGDEISEFVFQLLEVNFEDYKADVKYKLSFKFTNNGITHDFDQTVTIDNDEVIAFNIPPIFETEQTELTGCWSDRVNDNNVICFDTLNEGRYIQKNYNGETGILTNWFTYEVDFNTNSIKTQNHHIQFKDDCCDTEVEEVFEDWKSEIFTVNDNILTIGQNDFIEQ
jgi:hypothetical protein